MRINLYLYEITRCIYIRAPHIRSKNNILFFYYYYLRDRTTFYTKIKNLIIHDIFVNIQLASKFEKLSLFKKYAKSFLFQILKLLEIQYPLSYFG